jgi:hypothetical protein
MNWFDILKVNFPSDFQRFLVEVFGIPSADTKKLTPSLSLMRAISDGKLTEEITENEFEKLTNLAEAEQYENFLERLEEINSNYMEKYKERSQERRRERYANDPEFRRKLLEGNKKTHADPEFREKRNRQRKERRADDPEYKEKINRQARERYAKRKKGPVRQYRRKKERKE